MIDVKEILIDTLKELGYPVRLQGSLLPDEPYPDSFFTYWNNPTTDWHHYDNKPNGFVWTFDVNFYSTDPVLVNTMIRQARTKLIEKGFIIDGVGFDMPTDWITHTGRGIDAVYIEKEA